MTDFAAHRVAKAEALQPVGGGELFAEFLFDFGADDGGDGGLGADAAVFDEVVGAGHEDVHAGWDVRRLGVGEGSDWSLKRPVQWGVGIGPWVNSDGWSDFVSANWLDLAGKFGPLPRGGRRRPIVSTACWNFPLALVTLFSTSLPGKDFVMRLSVACPYVLAFGLISLAAAVSPVQAKAPQEAAVPKYVKFAGKQLNLAWQSENPELPVAEFIPEGETLEKWTHLASIRRFPEIGDAQGLAKMTVEQVAEQYPGAPTNIQNDPKGNDAVIEFVVNAPDDSFAEYNLFKYAKDADGGVIAEQYALRTYGDRKAFMDGLTARRQKLLDEMATTGLGMPGAEEKAK